MKKIGTFLLIIILCCTSWMPALAAGDPDNVTYELYIQDVPHGNVYIMDNQNRVTNIKAGQKVILRTNPNEGYITEKVNIKGKSGTIIDGSMKENMYVFFMPEEECQVETIFSEVTEEDNVTPPAISMSEKETTQISSPEITEPEVPELDSSASLESEIAEESKESALDFPEETSEETEAIINLSTKSVGIQYYGKVTYLGTTVGAFTVNGDIAFCLEHQKPTPDTGTSFKESIYDNANIRKVLYYGWAGHEQWNGFSSYEQGVVVTSLALSYYYSGPDTMGMLPHGSSAQKIGLSDFFYFIDGKTDVPDNRVNLNKSTSDSFLTPDKTMQRSDDFVLKAGSNNSITVPLEAGMSLVNVSTGSISKDSAIVKGGETFYITAPLTMNKTWSTGAIAGSVPKFNSVLAMTDQPGLQDLGYGKFAIDPTNTVSIAVKWEALGQIVIQKTDQDTSEAIAGTEFTLYADQEFLNPDGTTVYQKGQMVEKLITDTSGKTQSKPTYLGKYRVTETKQTPGYLYEAKEFFVELKPGASVGLITETIAATNQSTNIIINKTDSESGNVMPGVVFALQKISEDPVDPGFSNDKEFYTTDENGSLSINKLVPGNYLLGEYQQLPGYIRDDTQYHITVNDNGEISLAKKDADPANQSEETVNELKNILTLDIKNYSNRLIINKSDLGSGKALSGITFSFWKVTQDDIDPGFTNQKEAFLTDEKGEISFSKLPEGTYQLQETETLPGYALDETIYTITVDDKGEFSISKEKGTSHHGSETLSALKNELKITLKNDVAKGKIEITKKDSKTSALLDGACFDVIAKVDIKSPDGTILVKQGAVVDQITTSKGIANTKFLPLGAYTVKETKSPDGYRLSKQDYSVELTYKDQKTPLVVEKLEITNEKIVSTTVKTGDSVPLLPIILLISISICLIVTLLLIKLRIHKKSS